VYKALSEGPEERLVITFPVTVPKNFSEAEVLQLLEAQGYTKIHRKDKGSIEVIQDRVRIASTDKSRVMDALEAAMRVGQGRVNIYPENQGQTTFSNENPPLASLATPLSGGQQKKTWSVSVFKFSADLH